MSRDYSRFTSRGTLLSLVCVAGVTGVIVAHVSAEVATPAQASAASSPGSRSGGETTIAIDQLMPAPAWALAQRALLAANGDGVQQFANKYVDARGYLRGPAHWGISDGPDDAVEPIRNWPLAHALGGAESIIDAWDKVWEGHLEQYSRTKVPEVAVARDGIYYREFTPSFDWEHISEGLAGFYFSGLSRPLDPRYAIRLRRFAGFYLNEDPGAPNYDPKLKIVRSLFNGSRGPKLTPATPDDWDGPEVPGATPARRTRFLKASNIRGDHPLNLNIANLVLHAYLVTGDEKYRNWVLEFVGAWRDRIAANGGNIPSNIGLDGRVGGEWGGKWYGGVFGWNSPDEGVRNYVFRGPPEAFGAALLLTGDQAWTQVLRGQIDNLYAAKKVENGRVLVPHYYGDAGWYGYYDVDKSSPGLGNRRRVETDVYLWSLNASDLERLPKTGWIGFLEGKDRAYPFQAFQDALGEVRRAAQRLREDTSTEDFPPGETRWSNANPVATTALVNLTLGGNDPGGSGHGPLPLHTQVRHFDPVRRRAGLPEDVAALVEQIRAEAVVLTLVNTSPIHSRTVMVQMGAYGEHHSTAVTRQGQTHEIDAPYFSVRLAPGAGDTLTIGIRRYAHLPTLAFPWDRGWKLRQ
jgi:hypothetical protein